MMDEKDIFNNNGEAKDNSIRRDDIYSRLDDSSDMEDADEDLLALLDMISAQDEKQKGNTGAQISNNTVREEYVPQEETNDIFSIDDFNLDSDEARQDEIHQKESFREEEAVDSFVADQILEVDQKASAPKSKNMDNVSDIFSDALSAMDSLEDDDDLLGDIKSVPEKKIGFFQKLLSKFSKKDKKEEKNNVKAKALESKKGDKEETKTTPKKESKNTKADKTKNNKSKTAKAKPSKNTQEKKKPVEELLTEEEKAKLAKKKEDKAKAAAAKAEKKKAADAKKTEKKKAAADKATIKKQKKQEKKDLTPPDPDDNIKLNPLGVVFILTFFILIAGVVIVGTKTYSYGLDVRTASIEYSRGRYTEAYYSIYGVNVKKQDYKTYDKIMTTMYVNKELNSYYNYIEVNRYPEALDSLLKGLNRYDIHIAHAKELGIEKNLKSIKKQILKELKDTYGITEKQADTINAIGDRAKYSVKVINIANEKEKEQNKEQNKTAIK